jgi:hypothetical protein
MGLRLSVHFVEFAEALLYVMLKNNRNKQNLILYLMLKPFETCLTVIPGSASFGAMSTSHSTV